MDYKQTYELIIAWAGCQTQYWQAVTILKDRNQLTDTEIAQVDKGLDNDTQSLVESKMQNLKDICLGSENFSYFIDVDDAVPDASHGTATYVLPENSGATEITGLDNAVVGTRVTLKWASTSNHSSIANGATFKLADDFTPAQNAILVLEVKAVNQFEELYRFLP